MKAVRLLKFMDSMMSAYGSMVMQMFGRCLRICSTIFHLQRWLNLKYFACMVDCHRPLKHLIIYVILIGFKRCLMKVLCVIFCGLIQMIAVDGVSLPEVLDIHLARTYLSNLTIRTT